MQEYDIYLPTARNDGKPIDGAALKQIKQSLADAFGGYTYFDYKNEGVWRIGGVTFCGQVTVVRVLDDGFSKFDIAQFKQNLEQLLDQDSILIVAREIRVIGN